MGREHSPAAHVAMPDPVQLHHLVKLLDDDSPIVREEVVKAFAAFGPLLPEEIRREHIALTDAQRNALEPILEEYNRAWLRQVWVSWLDIKGDKARLEAALSVLAEFLSCRLQVPSLREVLDQLAESFTARNVTVNALELARFLFQDRGLTGVSPEEYYDPQNSNVLHVVEHRHGVPITLSCIYILVGHRIGLRIEGCNFPGHFLAIAPLRRRRVLVDCYNGGRFIQEVDLAAIHADVTLNDILRLECRSVTIVGRVLRNLMYAYQQAGKSQNAQMVAELLALVPSARQ
jgi:regulator of sirC expression with transglutaminase-like and TPR domain